ncbi:Histidine triad (HIT) family protein [gamma proteobacterium HdN1]|nr:Histidine triad (HIT) family protein [gamma proteobacterium HdN1]
MASIFTKIIDGQLPGNFVWKDDACVVILTIQPLRPGHMLVIPRAEIDHWDDLPDELAAHLMLVSKKMAKALKKAYPSARVGMAIAGLEVPHVHLHVFPINTLNDFDFSQAESAGAEALAKVAENLRAAL